MSDKLHSIREAEANSHTDAYTRYVLFEPGSWLARPVRTVLELLNLFDGYDKVNVLDLGSGVGRNSIPVAQYFRDIHCHIDCVDILELAIQKLNENAQKYNVAGSIRGIVAAIDEYKIQEDSYDLIIGISALEHIASRDAFCKKLVEIQRGLLPGGVACLIVNSGVTEHDKISGEERYPQFEVNLPTDEMLTLLEETFTGWKLIKHTVVHQKYDIPRENGLSALETNVVTYVARKNISPEI